MSDSLFGAAALGFAPLSETKLPSGQLQDTWQDAAGNRVVGIGPPGLQVSVVTKAGEISEVTAAPPAISKSAAATTPGSSASIPSVRLTSAYSPSPSTSSIHADSYIYTSWCAGYYPSGQEVLACDVEYMLQQSGADWYLGDHITTTANATGLQEYASQLDWTTPNQFVQWSPTGPTGVGGCQTVNEGLSFDGWSANSSYQVCSETVGPYVNNDLYGYADFSMTSSNACGWILFWDTCPSGGQGFNASDVVHSPSNAPYDPVLSVHMQWNGGNNAGGAGANG